jgi:sugar/nucleoside kinase (ribokinase family)
MNRLIANPRLVSLIALLLALGVMTVHPGGIPMHNPLLPVRAHLLPIGAGVLDILVGEPGGGKNEKVSAAISLKTGGGPANCAHAASQAAQVRTTLVLLTGDDDLGPAVVARARGRVPVVLPDLVLSQTRVSVLVGGRAYAARYPAVRRLHWALEMLVRHFDGGLLIGPMLPADSWFVRGLLTLGRARKILMLSELQARDPRSRELMALADLVVMNRNEMQAATGTDDLLSGLCRLAELGARDAVVTAGAAGAVARIGSLGQWFDQAAFRVKLPSGPVRANGKAPASRTGSGDTFTGILAGCLVSGDPFPTALRLAAAGAAHYVVAGSIPRGRAELERFAANHPEGEPPLLARCRAAARRYPRAGVWRWPGLGALASGVAAAAGLLLRSLDRED